MKSYIPLSNNPNYPSIEGLRTKTKKRIPKFALEYLDGGCFEELNFCRNKAEIKGIDLALKFLKK